MTRHNLYFTVEQELLLKSILFQGDEAIKAWEQWDSLVDINNVDYGSVRLFPQIYQLLKTNNIDIVYLNKLRGIYKKTIIKNKILYHYAIDIIRKFNKSEIKTVILKGGGLILGGYYQDSGLRPMDDIDILVPYDQKEKAVDILHDLGWTSLSDLKISSIRHSGAYYKGSYSIDLHWYFLITGIDVELDLPLWDRVVQTNYYQEPVYILNPTFQLMYVCLHGHHWNSVPPIRWIVDAHAIITKHGVEINWQELVENVKRRKMSVAMHGALNILHKHFNILIPDSVLKELSSGKNVLENIWYSVAIRKPIPIIGAHFKLFIQYLLLHRNKFPFPGYIRYLKIHWDLNSGWLVPLCGIKKIYRKLKKF